MITIKVKKYNFRYLLDDYNSIINRCHLIEEVSENFSFIPNTRITINDKYLLYEQDLIKKQDYSKKNNAEKLELLKLFAQDLDRLSETGFSHGDIKLSNVLYDGTRLILIDLEPSFKQIKYGKRVVMSAVPLRSINDLNNKTISSETDKIGFYLMCNKFLKIPLNIRNSGDLMKKRRNGFEFLPIKESEFMKFNFVDIFSKINRSINQLSVST